MKKKATTIGNPRKELVYSSLLDEIMVNDVYYPKFDLNWDASNYRESHLSTIKNRDRSLEFRLRFVNCLLMEYHTYRYWGIYDDGWFTSYTYLHDANTARSKALLLRALDYIEIILGNVFMAGQKWHRDYSVLTISLMLEIYKELGNYGVHLNPMKDLQLFQSAFAMAY